MNALAPLDPEEWQAFWLSLRIGFWSTALSLPLAYLLAYALARYRFPLRALVDGLVHLPLVLPPVVTGLALLLLFGRHGPLGRLLDDWFGITIAFKWTGAALASAVMGMPLMVRATRLSNAAIDRKLEGAARSLGANPFWVFLTVAMPLSLPGILAGAMLAFARGFGEFGATITFVSNVPGQTQTLPLAIYSVLQQPGGEAAALRLVALSVLLALLALALAQWGHRRVQAWLGQGAAR
jgi:molybdate transport system permease protein